MTAWTQEQIDRLMWLDELGESNATIATDIGRSERAVACKRHKLGLCVAPVAQPLARFSTAQLQAEVYRRLSDPTPERSTADALADRLHRNGWTQADLAREVGISTTDTSLLVRGMKPLTSALASRLARAFGEPADMWQRRCTEVQS